MSRLHIYTRVGTLLLVTLHPFLSSTAAADTPMDIAEDLMVISVMSLPLFGLFILLALSIPPLLRRDYPVEPVRFHLANVLAATALLTFIDAMIVPYLVQGGGELTLVLALGGIANLAVCITVFQRHLSWPLPWAAMVGGAFALVSVAWWHLALSMDQALLFQVRDVLALSLPFWVALFVGLLVLETLRHHHRPEEVTGPPMDPGRRDRTLRLGEMMVGVALAGAALAAMWA